MSNSLVDLRERLKVEHAAVAGALRTGLHHAMAAGDILIEAKSQIRQHGKWLPWLNTCGLSERTAQRYMRLARNRATIEAKSDSVSDLSLTGALAMLAVSRDTGHDIVDELVDLADHAIEATDGFADLHEREAQWKAQSEIHEALRDEATAALDRIGELIIARPELAEFVENDAERFAHRLIAASAEHNATSIAAAMVPLTVDEITTGMITAMSGMRDIAVEWLRRVEVEVAHR